MKNNIKLLRQKSIDFIHSKWASDCVGNNELDIDTNNFEKIANIVFSDITKDKKPTKKPFLFRVGGQSGSGKTTQLMPAIKSIIDEENKDFANIAVRTFAKYHPYYNQLLEEFGEGMIREKTNGFALMMLFRIMEKLLENKYNILLEVTILDGNFEKYLAELAKKNQYNVHFHILSVPREKSDYWIEKRKNNSKTEGKRIVLKSSSNYFYDVLPESLKKIIGFSFWNKNDKIFLWTGFNLKPVFGSKINSAKSFMDTFFKYRNLINFEEVNEEELLKSKIKWFNEYYG